MKLAWLGLSLLAACGSEPGMHLVVPFPSELASCNEKVDVGAHLNAFLRVGGGYLDCELAVDPATLAATGDCKDIKAGAIRPAMIYYRYKDQPVHPDLAPLAFWVTSVDLCDEDGGSVNVPLVNDGVSGTVFYDEAQLVDLPAYAPSDDLCSDDLEDAKAWAGAEIAASRFDLDLDDDLTANLLEACDGTLY